MQFLNCSWSGPILGKAAAGAVRVSSWYMPIRAVGEFVFALVLFLATAPLWLLAMVLVKLTSRGPMLYTQTRLGRDGRPFTIYKIRTMTHGGENRAWASWSQPGSSRITPVGRWLRRAHLDELPQLWNVLQGQMSLIGPRPDLPEFVPQLERTIPLYQDRLLVRPGLTGLAQVQLPSPSDLTSVRLRLAHDLYYLHHAGLFLDLRILLATGLHLLGLPFPWIGRFLGLPRQQVVEQFYRDLLINPENLRKTGAPTGTPAAVAHLEMEKLS